MKSLFRILPEKLGKRVAAFDWTFGQFSALPEEGRAVAYKAFIADLKRIRRLVNGKKASA